MSDTASELFDLLERYFNEKNDLWGVKRSKMDIKYEPINWALDTYDYSEWVKKNQMNCHH